jgi:hypothetical protein
MKKSSPKGSIELHTFSSTPAWKHTTHRLSRDIKRKIINLFVRWKLKRVSGGNKELLKHSNTTDVEGKKDSHKAEKFMFFVFHTPPHLSS